MGGNRQAQLTPHAIFGVVIALMGVIFTLDNLGLAEADSLTRFWPLVPTGVGLLMLMQADTAREWVFGSAWMASGGVLLARNLGYLSFDLRDFLPLLLVALGVHLMWRDRRPVLPPPPPPPPTWEAVDPLDADTPLPADTVIPPPIPEPPPRSAGDRVPEPRERWDSGRQRWQQRDDPWWNASFGCGSRRARHEWQQWMGGRSRRARPRRNRVRMLALMSGVERRMGAELFEGAEMTAIMGACELDLRRARTNGNVVYISAFAIWGGIEIRVPPDWVVDNQAMALMGGVEDVTRHVVEAEGRPTLIVSGFALMAGIAIKN